MKRESEDSSWLSSLGWLLVWVFVVMLLELLPLVPVTTAAWGALFWIALGITACAWIHFEVIGFPEDDELASRRWLHYLPWAVLLIFLFVGQGWWWSEFMQANFRSIFDW